jgi:hypothetical protein
MEDIVGFREETGLPKKIASLRRNLDRLRAAVGGLDPKDHLEVLENLEKNWFLHPYLMSPKKAMLWMSSLGPEMEDQLQPKHSIPILQEVFSQAEAHRHEEMGTFLLLKALQPLFATHPNFMDREFARQLSDIVIL